MVAYGFKKQFVAPIEERTKLHTMRNERKRHSRVGEEMQLYYALRTKHCRLIGRPRCKRVEPVRLTFGLRPRSPVPTVSVGTRDIIKHWKQLDAFAVSDGFGDWAALEKFWEENHAEAYDAGAWSGVLIGWRWA